MYQLAEMPRASVPISMLSTLGIGACHLPATTNIKHPIPPSSSSSHFHVQHTLPSLPFQEHHYGGNFNQTVLSSFQSQPQETSTSLKPNSHSHRDSGVSDVAQTAAATTSSGDRPDSQASQSSTTDSEDSGFRSSHTPHTSGLSKQGNPLLKPLRRPRNNGASSNTRGRSKRTQRNNSEDPSLSNGARPPITLSPKNLAHAASDANVIQTMSLLQTQDFHNQQSAKMADTPDLNSDPSSQSGTNSSKSSPVHNTVSSKNNTNNNLAQSPSRDSWPPDIHQQDMQGQGSDISTHLSWKYLQELSSNMADTGTSGREKGGGGRDNLGGNKKTLNARTLHQTNSDQPAMEMFGFSVV